MVTIITCRPGFYRRHGAIEHVGAADSPGQLRTLGVRVCPGQQRRAEQARQLERAEQHHAAEVPPDSEQQQHSQHIG